MSICCWWPDPLADPQETAEALDELVRAGKALHVGVSNYSPVQMDALQKHLKTPLVTNQLELSVKAADIPVWISPAEILRVLPCLPLQTVW